MVLLIANHIVLEELYICSSVMFIKLIGDLGGGRFNEVFMVYYMLLDICIRCRVSSE